MVDQQSSPKDDKIQQTPAASESDRTAPLVTQLEAICGPLTSAPRESTKAGGASTANPETRLGLGLKQNELLSALLTTSLIATDDSDDDEPKESAKAKVDDKNYKPTAEELEKALKSDNPSKALAKIADRLAEVEPTPGKGLNNPEFRTALTEHIKKTGLSGALEFAKETGPGYIVNARRYQFDKSIRVQFQKPKEGVANAIDDLKVADPQASVAQDWAKRIGLAVKSTGPEKGLNDPKIRKNIEDFVAQNYLEGNNQDLFTLQKQLLDELRPNYLAELLPNEADQGGINLRFFKAEKDSEWSHISDMTIRPYASQADTAANLAKEFNGAWGNPAQIKTAMTNLNTAFRSEIGQAKVPGEGEARCRALVAKINEANPTGTLTLPREFRVSHKVKYLPSLEEKFDLDL